MNNSTVRSFIRTQEKTNAWLNGLMRELDWDDRELAYHAMRTVLHALRDCLPVAEVVDFGAQLPMLMRGCYYSGWKPNTKPAHHRRIGEFMVRVAGEFPSDSRVHPEAITRAVFKVIKQHVSQGEVDDIKSTLPPDLRLLWSPEENPDEPTSPVGN